MQNHEFGNPRGKPPGSRNRFSSMFIHAMTTDFELHGVRVIERVRKSHPAVYLKVCAMLMPRELHVQDDPISKLTDEQLDEYLQIVRPLAEAKRTVQTGANFAGNACHGATACDFACGVREVLS